MPNLGKGTECFKLLLSQAGYADVAPDVRPGDLQRPARYGRRHRLRPRRKVDRHPEPQPREGRLAPLPLPLRQPMLHLQPARAEPPAPRRGAVDHRRLLRLLGDALRRPQGHRHSLGNAAEAFRCGNPLDSKLSTELHMYPDRDAPGERLFLQLKQLLPNLQHHQLPTGCKDFGELYLATRRRRAP